MEISTILIAVCVTIMAIIAVQDFTIRFPELTQKLSCFLKGHKYQRHHVKNGMLIDQDDALIGTKRVVYKCIDCDHIKPKEVKDFFFLIN